MKKIFFSLIFIFLANFFTIIPAYCGEDFFIDSNFSEAKNKIKISASKVAKSVEKTKKKGLFSKIKTKTKFNYATNREEEIPQGYYGTLPDIESDFAYKKQSAPSSNQNDLNYKYIDDKKQIENK